MLLKAENLNFAYSHIQALLEVNFHLQSGELLGIVGPNGAGKSTLLKILSGLLMPQQGKLWIKEQPARHFSCSQLAGIVAYLPQDADYAFDFKVFDYVLMGRFSHLSWWSWETQADLALARENMRLVKIEHLAERSLSSLSGGERQRVSIARALTQEAEILILDEPVSHLDINFQIDIMELLHRVRERRRASIILSVHDLNLASCYCERLVLLKDGRVHSEGTPAEVLTLEKIKDSFGARVKVIFEPAANRPWVVPEKLMV
jgi:iron complex transport system ATP-binding protein